jgi:ABC-type Mn2+/Zn2+ transport system ATPase subunit
MSFLKIILIKQHDKNFVTAPYKKFVLLKRTLKFSETLETDYYEEGKFRKYRKQNEPLN